MAIAPDPEVLRDDLAVSLARVVSAANKRATELGIDVHQNIICITQITDAEPRWRVNYGRKDYIGRRGGDLIVDVDADNTTIKRVFHGQ